MKKILHKFNSFEEQEIEDVKYLRNLYGEKNRSLRIYSSKLFGNN